MVILTIFLSEIRPRHYPADPPSISQHSNQFLVAGRVECGGWWVRSRAYSLALSKWTIGAAPIWAWHGVAWHGRNNNTE